MHPPAAETFEGFGAERTAHRDPHRVEVDAEAGEQLGVAWRRPAQLGLDRRPHDLDVGGQQPPDLRWHQIAMLHQGKQQMLSPHPAVAEGPGFRDRRVDDGHRVGITAVEHPAHPPSRPRRTRCFLWTDWRVTPNTSAIACHDQPSARALSTCSSSSSSTSCRNDATAANPTAGSRLLAAASSSCRLSMHVNVG